MPFLHLDKEQFLEYDLAKMVSSLTYPVQKKVGLLSSLDMQPGFDPASQGFREGWVVYDQLDQLFDVQVLSPVADELPAGLDLLFLVHPKDLSERMRYQLDQFVLGGGRLVAFLEPGTRSGLEELLELLLALRGRLLHVDEAWPAAAAPQLVLDPGELRARCDPAVALPVDADEDVALVEVGAIEVVRPVRPRTQLEAHRDQA